MKKPGFWKADWFLGLVVVLVMMVASRGDLIQSLERKAYDLGVKAASRTPSDRIAIIAIDDASIANIGRWPWSREVQARMIGSFSTRNSGGPDFVMCPCSAKPAAATGPGEVEAG